MNIRKIIIADHQQHYAECIFNLLNNSVYKVVGYATDGLSLINLIKGTSTDLVLLDINIPRLSGFDSANMLKSLFPNLKVIMLSTYHEPRFYHVAFNNNFDGYIMKRSGGKEIIDEISKVFSNENVF